MQAIKYNGIKCRKKGYGRVISQPDFLRIIKSLSRVQWCLVSGNQGNSFFLNSLFWTLNSETWAGLTHSLSLSNSLNGDLKKILKNRELRWCHGSRLKGQTFSCLGILSHLNCSILFTTPLSRTELRSFYAVTLHEQRKMITISFLLPTM